MPDLPAGRLDQASRWPALMDSRSVDPDLGELGRIEAPDGLGISGMTGYDYSTPNKFGVATRRHFLILINRRNKSFQSIVDKKDYKKYDQTSNLRKIRGWEKSDEYKIL